MTAVSREMRTRVAAAAVQAMARAGLVMPAAERLFGRFVEEFGLTPEEAREYPWTAQAIAPIRAESRPSSFKRVWIDSACSRVRLARSSIVFTSSGLAPGLDGREPGPVSQMEGQLHALPWAQRRKTLVLGASGCVAADAGPLTVRCSAGISHASSLARGAFPAPCPPNAVTTGAIADFLGPDRVRRTGSSTMGLGERAGAPKFFMNAWRTQAWFRGGRSVSMRLAEVALMVLMLPVACLAAIEESKAARGEREGNDESPEVEALTRRAATGVPSARSRMQGRWTEAAARVMTSVEKEETGQQDELTLGNLDERVKQVEDYVVRRSQSRYVRRAPGDAWDIRFGGRVFEDWAVPEADPALEAARGPFRTGSLFRKARLVVMGSSNPELDFKFELDFADGDADPTDVYMTLPFFGNSRLRAGRHKESFGLENLGSSQYTEFMERSGVSDALIPGRNTGFSVWGGDPAPAPGWWAGYFRSVNGHGVTADEGGHNFTFRYTREPVFEDDGRKLIHVGAAYSHRDSGRGGFRFQPSSGSHLVPTLADTGVLDAKDAEVLGLQFGAVRGPFSVSAEAARSVLDFRDGHSGELSGGYASISWFLTGEHRPFDQERRSWGRVFPRRNWNRDLGGAWQLALRYSTLDLTDPAAGVDGGDIREWTLALNWYIHQNARIHLDYVRPEVVGVGEARIVQTRFQFQF